jgi:hypothetical protein
MQRSRPAFPDANPILAASLAAVAPGHGHRALLTPSAADALTEHGVRVRLATSAAQQTTLAALHALGYAARSETGPAHDERCESILVTGWHDSALAVRATRLELALTELVLEHAQFAANALTSYRCLLDLAQTASDAQTFVLFMSAMAPRHRPAVLAAGRVSVMSPVAAVDRRTAAEPTRGLLLRIRAAQAALDKLVDTYRATARGVIGLYDEYRTRHGYSDEAAAAAALSEAHESNAVNSNSPPPRPSSATRKRPIPHPPDLQPVPSFPPPLNERVLHGPARRQPHPGPRHGRRGSPHPRMLA